MKPIMNILGCRYELVYQICSYRSSVLRGRRERGFRNSWALLPE